MKFLFLILTFNILNLVYTFESEVTIDNDFMNRYYDYKYILPEEESITKIDTRLLVRVSLPSQGFDGIYSYSHKSHFKFDAAENDSFIIVKIGANVQSYNVKSAVLKLKNLFEEEGKSSKPVYELWIICTKNENKSFFEDGKKSKKEFLILSIPIKVANIKDNSNKILKDFVSQNAVTIKGNFQLMNLFTDLDKKFYYFQDNAEENSDIRNYFIFKSSIKITTHFKENIERILKSQNTKVNHPAVEPKTKNKITFESEGENNQDYSNFRRDFVYFSDDSELKEGLLEKISTHTIEIEPEKITKNYFQRVVTNRLKFDYESLNLYLKSHHQEQTYDKILIGNYLQQLHDQYKSEEIDEDKVKEEFETIYKKFIKIKIKTPIDVKYPIVQNTTHQVQNKTHLPQFHNSTNNHTNEMHFHSNVTTHFQEEKANHTCECNKMKNQTLQPKLKVLPKSASHHTNTNTTKHNFSPMLKNEKIKYVNGSLVVIQTLMLGGKDEKIADMKRKFNDLIKQNSR